MRPRTLPLAIVALVGLGFVPACGGRPTPSGVSRASRPDRAPRVSTRTYKLVGVVRRVSPGSGQVVIAHESIPGFMDAMTMPFTLKDHEALDDVRQGDEVEGSLRVEKEADVVKDYELEDLVVTRPALAARKSLAISARGLELREAPKRLETGREVPDFAMTTQEGKVQKLSDLRGHVVVLTFIYTRCPLPDFCPWMDRKFAQLADKVAASPKRSRRVRLLSVSFDPEHDTPEVLRKHAKVQGGSPPLWTFAVASHAELARVAAPLGLTYGPLSSEIAHNLCTAVIDPEGKLARLEVGASAKAWPPVEMLRTISSLLDEGGRTAVAP